MSSTLQQPSTVADAPAVPVPDVDDGHAVDRGFGLAVVLGAVTGIVAFSVLMGVLTKILLPDWEMGGVVAVAVWTGIWGGLFLGGTVTVGLWAGKNFH